MNYLKSQKILCLRTKWSGLGSSGDERRTWAPPDIPGMADILALFESNQLGIIPVWLETGLRRSEQTLAQKSFQAMVESKKHVYIPVRSLESLMEYFEHYK